jgi:hypothetical protein
MTKIDLTLEKAMKAYDEAESLEVKNAIANLIGKEHFDPYIKACIILNIKPKPELEDKSDDREVWADNALRLSICVEAKNIFNGKIWKPKYDGSEQHWYPVPDMRETSGFGLSYTAYAAWAASSTVGSRLEYRERKLAEEGFKEFKKYYKIHYTK